MTTYLIRTTSTHDEELNTTFCVEATDVSSAIDEAIDLMVEAYGQDAIYARVSFEAFLRA